MPRKQCDLCGKVHRKLTRRECLLGRKRHPGVLYYALKEAMRLRDNRTCQRCGRTGLSGDDEHMSHVYRKARCARLKYELANVKTLCASCHRWWHDYEMEAVPWFRETWPGRAKELDQLREEYQATQGTVPIDWYCAKLKELEAYIFEAINTSSPPVRTPWGLEDSEDL